MPRKKDPQEELIAPVDTSNVARDSVRISALAVEGFEPPAGRVPGVGERVYCVDGHAEVVRVLGRTSDGSRLMELALLYSDRAPFFAASSNVLVRSASSD